MLRSIPSFLKFSRSISAKQLLKDYVFPEIRKEDCEQKYISGWGPGGQKVNTAQNAVMLKHKPTGITVKVHESRLLPDNINIAFERIKLAVDQHINGENSYQSQLQKLQKEIEIKRNQQRKKKRLLKKELQNDNNIDGEINDVEKV
uniref:Prokaryotic-type class I peptide chain release factors domain-containing protein n=1 Tax=Panagrolaimus sp. PS1159 TaxID=55785 RepID=A0AC35ERH1_9BILA